MTTPKIVDRFFAFNDNVKGALVLMAAAMMFSVMVLLIKIGGEDFHVTQILLVRQVVMTLIIAPTILKNFPGSLATKRIDLQILRIALALIAMVLGFSAVIHMPLADATAIGFAKSFFVTIFAVIFLKEIVGPRRWGAVALGFVGVTFMLQPGATGFSVYGLFALISAASAGMVMVIIRYLSRFDPPVTILTYQAIGVGLVMLAPGIYFWQPPSPTEWAILIAIGVISYLAQMANIYAYKWGEASVLASLDYVRLLYTTLFGFLFFGNLPGFETIVGAFIIIAAAIYTIRREAATKQALTRAPDGRGYNQ